VCRKGGSLMCAGQGDVTGVAARSPYRVKAEVSAAGTRTPGIAALDEKRRFAWNVMKEREINGIIKLVDLVAE
jgi:hypothetical protein